MTLKFKSGDRSLKKYPEIQDIVNSCSVLEPEVNKKMVERFKEGDMSPEVNSYFKNNFRPWKHIILSKEKIDEINKIYGKPLIKEQNVPCIVSTELSFMIIQEK